MKRKWDGGGAHQQGVLQDRRIAGSNLRIELGIRVCMRQTSFDSDNREFNELVMNRLRLCMIRCMNCAHRDTPSQIAYLTHCILDLPPQLLNVWSMLSGSRAALTTVQQQSSSVSSDDAWSCGVLRNLDGTRLETLAAKKEPTCMTDHRHVPSS